MIVFNLDTLVAFGWATYNALRRKCIQKMTENSRNETWKTRGRRFKRFEPDRGSDKPSEWFILLFCFLHPFALLKKSKTSAATQKEHSKKDKEPLQAQNWKWWLRLPRRKPISHEEKDKGREDAVSGKNQDEPV
jgi:hypothetical protein